jgi:hypothetical protein
MEYYQQSEENHQNQNYTIERKENTNELIWKNGSFNEKTQRPTSMNKQHSRMYQDKKQIVDDFNYFSNEQQQNNNNSNGLEVEVELESVFHNNHLANIDVGNNRYEGDILSVIQDQGFVKKNNKREGQNEKLSSRHMMIQKGVSPFINPNDYVKHLETENDFLRPKDSNYIE